MLFVHGTGLARASENEEIERIVVTASRTPDEIKNSTKSISIISQDAIEESNAQTIPDILRSEAGIEVRDYNGTGKQVNIDMRGFGETGPSNIAVLIDGRRVNAIDLSNIDWSQIPLNDVERIEIVRGASSVLYGDNASTGVINIITKTGKGKPSIELTSKGGSYNTASTRIESSGSIEKSSYRVSAEYSNTDGYRQNSWLFRKDFGASLTHAFNALLNTSLTFGYHTDKFGLPGALTGANISTIGRRATTTPDDKALSHDWFTQIQIKNDFQDNGVLTTDFSVRTREVDTNYASWSWINQNHIVTFGLTPRYTFKEPIGNLDNAFIAGLDLYWHEDDIQDGFIASPNDKLEIKKRTIGLYTQDQMHLNKHLLIKAGARHEIARYDFDQIEQVQLKEKSHLSDTVFNVGTALTYGNESSLFLDYSTSFRYPLVDEFFVSNTFGGGGLNASLEAQTGKNIEAGIRHFFNDDIYTSVTFFTHFIENEIFFNPFTFANSNYDHTIHRGVEFSSNFRLNEYLKLFANYTYTSAKFGKGSFKDNEIPAVPRHKSSAGIRMSPTENLKINVIANYIGNMYLISDQNNALPKLKEWVTLDLNANYLLGNFEIFFGVNNITNTYYAEYGVASSTTQVFYPSPGRNVIAGCRYKF